MQSKIFSLNLQRGINLLLLLLFDTLSVTKVDIHKASLVNTLDFIIGDIIQSYVQFDYNLLPSNYEA